MAFRVHLHVIPKFQITDKVWTIITNNVSILMHTNTFSLSMCIYLYCIFRNKLVFSNKDPKDHGTEFPSCISENFLIPFKEKNIRF